MSLAGQLGGIEPLLQAFFSFLHRKTDFYVAYDRSLKAPPRMGFPTGAAEALVLKHFRAFPTKAYEQEVSRLKPAQAAPTPKIATTKKPPAEPQPKPKPVSSSKPVSIDDSKNKPQRSTNNSADGHTDINPLAAKIDSSPATPDNRKSPSTEAGSGSVAALPHMPNTAAASSPPVAPEPSDEQLPNVKYSERGKQVPVGNGGVTPHYHWTQTLYEVTVYVPVPKGSRAADLKVTIAPERIELGFKSGMPIRSAGGSSFGDASGWLLSGQFPESVKPDESCWMVEDDPASEDCNVVLITLDKIKRTWWDSVCVGHPEVDTQLVDSTCKMDEYDSETQVHCFS